MSSSTDKERLMTAITESFKEQWTSLRSTNILILLTKEDLIWQQVSLWLWMELWIPTFSIANLGYEEGPWWQARRSIRWTWSGGILTRQCKFKRNVISGSMSRGVTAVESATQMKHWLKCSENPLQRNTWCLQYLNSHMLTLDPQGIGFPTVWHCAIKAFWWPFQSDQLVEALRDQTVKASLKWNHPQGSNRLNLNVSCITPRCLQACVWIWPFSSSLHGDAS